MIWSAVFAFLHLLTIGLAAGMLLVEHWLLRRPVDRTQARLLGIADLTWLLALIGSLATGLARSTYFGMGAPFYLANPLFLVKLGAFALLVTTALVNIRLLARWNYAARNAAAFAPLSREVERLRAAIALELGLVVLLTFLAVLVTRGFGS